MVFETIAVWLWQATGKLFFLLNFSYIGIWVALGLLLFTEGWKYAREFTQFGVGSYMLVFLGLICRENLQIEGLWYYLLCGVVGLVRSIMLLLRFSARYYSGEDGVDLPVGQL